MRMTSWSGPSVRDVVFNAFTRYSTLHSAWCGPTWDDVRPTSQWMTHLPNYDNDVTRTTARANPVDKQPTLKSRYPVAGRRRARASTLSGSATQGTGTRDHPRRRACRAAPVPHPDVRWTADVPDGLHGGIWFFIKGKRCISVPLSNFERQTAHSWSFSQMSHSSEAPASIEFRSTV
jgi:hypothetical protein